MSQSTQDRSEYILQEAYAHGRVAVRDLAERLGVSEATVRRDLKHLADTGQMELVYGGAEPARTVDYSFRSKGLRNVEQKRLIGRLAAELVGDQDQILIDSGTTSFQLAQCLKGRRGLSVIVNSARLALELDAPGLQVIMLGGQYRPDRMDTIGPMATTSLEQLRGYVAFIGVDGLSREFGLAASDIESAHLFSQAVRNSRKTVLLADQSKFRAPSLFKIVDFDRISQVVTDRRPDEEWMRFLEGLGIEVISPHEPRQRGEGAATESGD
jgi:DeoR family transcriptional regulator of aga operon